MTLNDPETDHLNAGELTSTLETDPETGAQKVRIGRADERIWVTYEVIAEVRKQPGYMEVVDAADGLEDMLIMHDDFGQWFTYRIVRPHLYNDRWLCVMTYRGTVRDPDATSGKRRGDV